MPQTVPIFFTPERPYLLKREHGISPRFYGLAFRAAKRHKIYELAP